MLQSHAFGFYLLGAGPFAKFGAVASRRIQSDNKDLLDGLPGIPRLVDMCCVMQKVSGMAAVESILAMGGHPKRTTERLMKIEIVGSG